MHLLLVGLGVVIVLVIVVHIIFKVIKFSFGVLFLGIALVLVIYVFRQYFGIDLLSVFTGHS
jgi:hypothetical protein